MVLEHVETYELPDEPNEGVVYFMPPNQPDSEYYEQRTDRNIGWLSNKEQEILKNTTIGIAGLGGMGGAVAPALMRMGIGALKIADIEEFDASNINRQFGATRSTIGKSKAIESARALRAITDDVAITVYPHGIQKDNVADFVDGCDLVLDMVEFWAVSPRIMLHKAARAKNITVMSANPVGMGARLFIFDEHTCDIESFMGVTQEKADEFEQKTKAGTITKKEQLLVLASVMTNFVPELPFYAPETEIASSHNALRKRMLEDSKPSVLGGNIMMAGGFLANHVALYLLQGSDVKRSKLPRYPRAPGYLYLDTAFMRAKLCHDGFVVRSKRWLYNAMVKRLAARMDE
ncbi:MAG: ThiF family adenylyltransferase [Rickettsiales bacterium]